MHPVTSSYPGVKYIVLSLGVYYWAWSPLPQE